ncbi:MAG TPA: DUF4349 domain-containing protein [Gaiellaceae bacterium]|nr:DUF4349 domain-containing protein [Gaiellaceae bacterium]
MNASPDLIRELEASRPTASPALRARVRELAAQEPARSAGSWAWWPRLPIRRAALVALPAAAALALVSAGAIGLSRSDNGREVLDGRTESLAANQALPGATVPEGAPAAGSLTDLDRAQRINATLTLEVRDSDAVSRAAQEALDLTRALGGHVVSSSVTTGSNASATLLVRVPVANVQSAITQLSALGSIVSQQIQVEDLQATLDQLRERHAGLRAQIARITARLESGSLDPETRAALEARRKTLRNELAVLRRNLSSTNAESRAATIQLTIATPDVLGTSAIPSRLDRTLDEALNVLAWEGIVALAVAIVLAPFALVALAAWLARRLYRRHEEESLLAAS